RSTLLAVFFHVFGERAVVFVHQRAVFFRRVFVFIGPDVAGAQQTLVALENALRDFVHVLAHMLEGRAAHVLLAGLGRTVGLFGLVLIGLRVLLQRGDGFLHLADFRRVFFEALELGLQSLHLLLELLG